MNPDTSVIITLIGTNITWAILLVTALGRAKSAERREKAANAREDQWRAEAEKVLAALQRSNGHNELGMARRDGRPPCQEG